MAEDVGRPTVMTPDVVNKLEQAFSLGATDVEACFYAGISKQTLYDYQAKHPEYTDRKAALKDKLILKARTVIAQSMEAGDKQTAQWYLERKKKDEFSARSEQTGADGQPLNPNDAVVATLSKLIDKLPS
jgi:hypothetical protein